MICSQQTLHVSFGGDGSGIEYALSDFSHHTLVHTITAYETGPWDNSHRFGETFEARRRQWTTPSVKLVIFGRVSVILVRQTA